MTLYICTMKTKIYNIIGHIYAQGLIFQECAKICKDADLCADLSQEVTMVLMEKPSELIEGLNERGEILFYTHRIAKNLFNSKTSPFYYKYKKFKEETTEYNAKVI